MKTKLLFCTVMFGGSIVFGLLSFLIYWLQGKVELSSLTIMQVLRTVVPGALTFMCFAGSAIALRRTATDIQLGAAVLLSMGLQAIWIFFVL